MAQLQLSPLNGWKGFPLLNQGEDIRSIGDPGYGNFATRGVYDGLGMFWPGSGSLSVWINHETNSAAISRVELSPEKIRRAILSSVNNGATPFPTGIKTGMGFAYDTIFDANFNAQTNPNPVASGTSQVANYGNANFDRFCSGTSHQPDAFGANRGFVDHLYLTGEEVSGGRFYALDEIRRELWEVDALGNGAWENAALMDTGNLTHVALVLSSDVGSGSGDYLRLYVGEKNIDANSDGLIDFLERNGLRGGNVYYFVPDSGYSTTDLPDGLVTGTWKASTIGALLETKLEDVHTNPLNGTQAILADQTDGLYVLTQILAFDNNGLDVDNSFVSLLQIDDRDVPPIGAPDNVFWSVNDKIFVEEDGNGDEIFEMNSDGSGVLQIAAAFSEPSGIIDISAWVDQQPGKILLTSVQGNGSTGAQLVVLVSPTAAHVLPPDSLSIVRGILSAGTSTDLVVSDNIDVSIQRNPVQTAGVIEFEVEAVSQITNPGSFAFTLESAGFFRSTVIQAIEFFDFSIAEFVAMDSRNASRFVDRVVTVNGTGDLSRFVEAKTGCVRARILLTSVNRRQSFSATIDQVFWSID